MWYIYMILSLYLITPFLRKVVAKADRKSINYLVFVWIIFMILVPFLNVIFKKNIKIYSPAGQYVGYFLIGYLLAEKSLNMKKWQKYTVFL
ncbi:acyltransferase family protein [Leptotrichia hofstadii]|nr:acyltransferase family protein [Leptotrichia hofstadii]